MQAAFGGLIGFSIHPIVLALSYRAEHDPTDNYDLRVMGYIAFGLVAATPVSWIVGAFLAWRPPSGAWRPRFRHFGLGLIVGASAGALGGLLWILALTL